MRQRNVLYAAFILLIILGNVASATYTLTSATPSATNRPTPMDERRYPGWDLPRKIAVIYDINDSLLTTTALNVLSSATVVYHNTFLMPIEDWQGLRSAIIDEDYWIKLYFINGTIDGVKIAGEVIAWQEIADVLTIARGSKHIFGSGSTDRLRAVVPVDATNVHIEGSPVIGAEQSFFYNLWEIGEILAADSRPDYQRVAEDFRILGVKYFANNMNRLVNGVIDPENIPDPLGEDNAEARRKAFDKTIADSSDIEQVLPDGSIRRFENKSTAPSQSSDPDSIVQIVREPESSQSIIPFLLGVFPKSAGIEGPAGDIMDLVLALIPTFIGDKIRLNNDVALNIIGLIGQLSVFMSDDSEGSGKVKETWRSLLDLVMADAPIPENLKPFLYLFVEAYTILRSDPQDILNLVKTLLTTIFETVGEISNSTIMNNMFSTLETTLLNTTELNTSLYLAEQQANASGTEFTPMNDVVTFVMGKILNLTTYRWFEEISGGTNPSDMLNAAKIMNLFSPLLNAIIVGNFEELMEEIPSTVDYLFDKTTSIELITAEKSIIEGISRFFHLAMVLYDQFGSDCGQMTYWTSQSSLQLFKNLISAALPSLGESSIENIANDLKDIYTDASVNLVTNRNTLITQITTLFTTYNIPLSAENLAFIDVLGWLGAIWVPTITEPSASDLHTSGKGWLNTVTNGANATILSQREEIMFTTIGSIFGMFALMKDNKAAQKLFVDDIATMEGIILEGGGNTTTGLTLEENKARFGQRIKTTLSKLINLYSQEHTNVTDPAVLAYAEFLATTFQVGLMGEGVSVKTFLRTVAMQAGLLYFDGYFKADSTVTMKIIQYFFAYSVGRNIFGGIDFYDERLTSAVLKLYLEQNLSSNFPSISTTDLTQAKKGVDYLLNIKDLFTGGIDYILQQFDVALAEFLKDLGGAFTTEALGIVWDRPLSRFKAKTAMTGADFVGIFLWIELWVGVSIEWDDDAFIAWISDMIYNGLNDFDLDPVDFF